MSQMLELSDKDFKVACILFEVKENMLIVNGKIAVLLATKERTSGTFRTEKNDI